MGHGCWDGKIVLITGGSGTFGWAFARALLDRGSPAEIRIFSRNESRQVEMQQSFPDDRLKFFIGDVQDSFGLARAMAGANIVMHAAAMKHVPICERQPFEAVQTNIVGTLNVIRTAIQCGVDFVMGLSTDKAVHPVNVYGAGKLIGERLFAQASSYDPRRRTRFACLRYGNVAGSNGSVVHLFRSQSRRGAVKITHPDMTRFWMTQDEVASFALDRLGEVKGGEIFVSKLPSVRIMDLAEVVAPGAEKQFVGIRPGEKIHETLVTEEEWKRTVETPAHFVIHHSFMETGVSKRNGHGVSGRHGSNGNPSRYSSDRNTVWLTGRELAEAVSRIP